MGQRKGLQAVGDVIDHAEPAPQLGRGKASAGRARREDPELPLLPPGCPVKPLGKLGQVCFYLDEQGQLINLDPIKHGKTHIRNLFGRQSQLCDEYWPRYSDKVDERTGERIIKGWKPEDAADLLMNACAHAGIFDPQGKVRGRGAHRGRDGELILHCGDKLLIGETANDAGGYQDPGLYGGFVYPTAPALPRPDPGDVDDTAGVELLELFRAWYWERPLIDPMLLLGWIAAAIIGGALRWRPHAWITGSSATGKSTLQTLLELLFDGAALHTHDASEAALRQILGHQTLPVFFDEIEADPDNRANMKVVKLARLASSGGVIFRGGQDHIGHEFVAKSCFLFSSILLPPILNQDRNRLAILELQVIPEGATAPAPGDDQVRELGRRIRRRLVDQWPRLEATLLSYKQSLAKNGHGGRSQDQFGTLLAVADLLLYDHEPDAELLAEWGSRLAIDGLAEKAMELSDELECVQFLATTPLQVRGGDEPLPISKHIVLATDPQADKAADRLEHYGLKLVNAIEPSAEGKSWGACKPKPGKPLYLAIANSHEALAKIFQGQRWSDGVWTQSFGRVPGAIKRVKVRLAGGKSQWATLIPLEAIVDLTEEK